VIHTDFEKGFIRVEIIGFEDFTQYKNESSTKKLECLEGKEYSIQDGDAIHFYFN
jgi:ribosome-binding ATPase YchF (GTP1/OBG family)